MTETAASPVKESSKAKVPKKKVAGAKAATTKPSHPPTAVMVNAAVETLKERGGSSLQAIKKYISSTYKVDAEKLAPFIRKYIKSAVASGNLVQTKGSGAAGSFKLPVAGATATSAGKKKTSKKAASPKKEKKVAPPSKAKKVKKTQRYWAPKGQGSLGFGHPRAPKPKKAVKSAATPKKPVAKKVVKKPVAKKASPKKK